MTVLKPRSRTISIRLSEEEYLGLLNLCTVTGARSVSDVTRDAMHLVLRGANRDVFLGMYVDEFRSQIKDLDRKIEQLAGEIASYKSNNGKETLA